ncbi:MAG: hypothetical protein LBI18_05565 [Planctomycetaceae bacterium]|jgi:hypothetical protein|nr:hypothetical protein [Planctomycetaceae bacterium]
MNKRQPKLTVFQVLAKTECGKQWSRRIGMTLYRYDKFPDANDKPAKTSKRSESVKDSEQK